MKFTEEQLKGYAAPLSTTENQKCMNAIKAIRDALKSIGYTASGDVTLLEQDTYSYSTILNKSFSDERIQLFIQGSYANNTCVRGESDVDIAVVRLDKYERTFGKTFNPYAYNNDLQGRFFKDIVERELKKYFPVYSVTRKNKSIKVDGNTNRKPADTVPSFVMRYYDQSDMGDYLNYKEGITIYADDGEVINNFPKQHIKNGKEKNVKTNYYYKKMVRIIKKMRYLMEDYGYESASKVSSFGLESLLWNLPNNIFKTHGIYRFAFEDIVKYLYNHKAEVSIYKEANGIKDLCPTYESIVNYKNFINDLYVFYGWK